MTDSPVTRVLLRLRHHTSGLPKFQNYVWKQHPHTKDITVAPSLHDSLILLPGYFVIHPGYPKY